MTGIAWTDAIAGVDQNGRNAQVCARLGWRVMPLSRTSRRPIIKHWPDHATTDLDTITSWFSDEYPGCLPGILTGPESGIWVLDIDVKTVNGFATVRDLFAAHGVTERPATFVVRTPSGGEHWYFTYPSDGRDIKCSASKTLGPGVDVRGWHGMVVAPMTRTLNGAYEIVDPTFPAEAPRWLEDLVEKRPYVAPDHPEVITTDQVLLALQVEADRFAQMPQGGRNQALNEAAFRLGLLGGIGVLGRETAWRELHAACALNGLLDDDSPEQCRATFDSGWNAGERNGSAHD